MTHLTTASKLIAPSRMASIAAAATTGSGKTSISRNAWMNSRLPRLPMRASKSRRRCWSGRQYPVLQGSRLIKRAGLLLEERQIVLRVEDELATTIDAWMQGDLARAANDRDLVDEALHQDVTKTIGRWHGIIVHAIARQRSRGDLARALVAGLEGRLTALLHHITTDLLEQSYLSLERDSAPGIDGVTWQTYGENLEEKLKNLHDRVHRGSYRARRPDERIFRRRTA